MTHGLVATLYSCGVNPFIPFHLLSSKVGQWIRVGEGEDFLGSLGGRWGEASKGGKLSRHLTVSVQGPSRSDKVSLTLTRIG